MNAYPLNPIRLGVNVDHVATLRNARGGLHPDPIQAARLALEAGADGITAHLREDRRHIRDEDLRPLLTLLAGWGKPLNLEIAAREEMEALALELRPHAVCLVPEKRQERTTESGLNIVGSHNKLKPFIRSLVQAGIRVSLFIDPLPDSIAAAQELGAPVIELHTGAWCHAQAQKDLPQAHLEFERLCYAAETAHHKGLECHAGHGLTYETAKEIARLPMVVEVNIGHFLIGEALYIGLPQAISAMRTALNEGRASPLVF